MQFLEGNKIKISSPNRDVIALAEIEESFPRDFGVYDLSEFVNVLNMFEDSDVVVEEQKLVISNDHASVDIMLASSEVLNMRDFLQKKISLPKDAIELKVSETQFNTALKVAKILNLPQVGFLGEKGKLYLTAIDAENTNGKKFKYEIGTTNGSHIILFNTGLLNFIPNDYSVRIFMTGEGRPGISEWTAQNINLKYYVLVDARSNTADTKPSK
jgi:hypothetical protein